MPHSVLFVITPWLTNHHRDLDTSRGLVNLLAGLQ